MKVDLDVGEFVLVKRPAGSGREQGVNVLDAAFDNTNATGCAVQQMFTDVGIRS